MIEAADKHPGPVAIWIQPRGKLEPIRPYTAPKNHDEDPFYIGLQKNDALQLLTS
jgi:hypothetical protein